MKPSVDWGDWSASANDPVIAHGQVNGTHLAHENRFYYWTYIMNINYLMGACFSPHCFPFFLPFTSSKQIMLKCPFSLLSALFHLLAAIKCSLTFQHRPVPYLLCILQCSLTPYEQYTSSQVWVEAAVSTLLALMRSAQKEELPLKSWTLMEQSLWAVPKQTLLLWVSLKAVPDMLPPDVSCFGMES